MQAFEWAGGFFILASGFLYAYMKIKKHLDDEK
jgi:hypothetical protein